ncbi:hypothetical protein GCM10008938_09800 [Deinococcus roseus]|uniref:Barstar (barnase inhibitor) domain-containing protein n=2 Tax=Deinococcus roseus TaxID=392414 RepID=A0ABQ2CX47_9DEIO|nr:hypothetical protein GCM10008938_09800 [Deinococcus roseus]
MQLKPQHQEWLLEQGWSEACSLEPDLVQEIYQRQGIHLPQDVLGFLCRFASFVLYIRSPFIKGALEQMQFDVIQLSKQPQILLAQEDSWDGQERICIVVALFLNSKNQLLVWSSDTEGLMFGLKDAQGDIHSLGDASGLLEFLKGDRTLHLDLTVPLNPRWLSQLEIDGSQLETPADLHHCLQKNLHFPAHHGHNIHALRDMLSTEVRRPLHLIWNQSEASRASFGKSAFQALVDVFQQAARADENQPPDQRFTFELK